jgi:DNA-binding MarR family transcriptional regulator
MIEQTPGTTRLVDRLERKGLVTRAPCPTDRRRVFCQITDQGLQLLTEMDEPVNQCEAKAVSVLASDDLTSLITLLDNVRSVNS